MTKLSYNQKQLALNAIAKQIENCKLCRQGKIGRAVPGEGNPDADIIFIGEAPGKTEAETGRPFVGRSGKLLRSLIDESGLHQKDVFITSPVKYLPIYITPTQEDIEHGRTHLFAQFDIIKPKIVVLLGNTAALAVLEKKFSIAQDRGTVIKRKGITYLITYHPAAPLYNPKVKKDLIEDFKKLKRLIKK